MHKLYSSRGLRACLSLAALTATIAAHAAAITQNFSFALERTAWTHTATLNKFDVSLGTLTSIDFSLDGTIQTDMKLANLSTQSVNSIVGNVFGNFALKSGSTSYVTGAVTITHSGTYDKSLNGLTPDYTNNRGQIFPRDTVTNTYTGSTSTSADKLLMSGVAGSTIAFDISTSSSSSSTSTAGNKDLDADTFGAATGFVRYNYTPVPEPASMAALGLGVLGLVRRRKAVRQ